MWSTAVLRAYLLVSSVTVIIKFWLVPPKRTQGSPARKFRRRTVLAGCQRVRAALALTATRCSFARGVFIVKPTALGLIEGAIVPRLGGRAAYSQWGPYFAWRRARSY